MNKISQIIANLNKKPNKILVVKIDNIWKILVEL